MNVHILSASRPPGRSQAPELGTPGHGRSRKCALVATCLRQGPQATLANERSRWGRHVCSKLGRCRMRLYRIVVLALALTLSGCATLVGGGSSQAVSMTATPSEARYSIRSSSGIQMSSGALPASVSLPRKNEYQLDVSLDGYETQTVAITRGTNGWIWGNLIFGWIVGFIIDFATGSAYKLEPSVVDVELERGQELVAVVRFLNQDRRVLQESRLVMVPLATTR